MKKILFLLGSYLPNPSPNGVCVEQIANELIKRGDNVTFIAYAEHNSSEYEKVNDMNIYRLKRGWIDNKLSYYNDKLYIKNSMKIKKKLILLKKIKQIIMLPIYPWTDLFYTIKLYKETIKLHKKEQFDAIICVHKPIDTLIVGHLVKKKYNSLIYISYFLDSLSGGFHLRIIPKEWSIKRRVKWEKLLLKNADRNIMMYSSMEHHLKYSINLGHYEKMIYLDIPLLTENKINYKTINNNILNKNKINIVYTGSLYYSSRNPEYILELFKKLEREDVALIFIGSSDCNKLFEEMREKFMGELLYYEHMEHDRILNILPDADFLLNIGVKNKNAISGKIFEYMSFGKPIISTYEIDEEPCIPYLEEYHLSLLIDQRGNIDSNAKILNSFLDKFHNVSVPFNFIKNKFHKNTPEAFLEVLDSTIGDDFK